MDSSGSGKGDGAGGMEGLTSFGMASWQQRPLVASFVVQTPAEQKMALRLGQVRSKGRTGSVRVMLDGSRVGSRDMENLRDT